MKVFIDGKPYEVDVNCNCIELEMTDEDKQLISDMPKQNYHYFVFNDAAEQMVDDKVNEINKGKKKSETV